MFSKIQRLGMGVVTNNETHLINYLLSLGAQMAFSANFSCHTVRLTNLSGL